MINLYNPIDDTYHLVEESIYKLIKIIWEKGIDTFLTFKIEEHVTITFVTIEDFQKFINHLKDLINLSEWKFEIIPVYLNQSSQIETLLTVKVYFHNCMIDRIIQNLLAIEND